MSRRLELVTSVIDSVCNLEVVGQEEAFDILLEWIAIRLDVEPGTCTRGLKKETYFYLDSINFKELLDTSENVLAQFYYQISSEAKKLFSLTEEELDIKLSAIKSRKPGGFPIAIFVLDSGTGELIAEINEHLKGSCIFYSNEKDIIAYRIQLIYSHIHNIKMFLTNKELHTRIDIDSLVWQYANQWTPSKSLVKL